MVQNDRRPRLRIEQKAENDVPCRVRDDLDNGAVMSGMGRETTESDDASDARPEERPDAGLIAAGVHRDLGLTDSEAQLIVALLGRAPTSLELAMYAVMWSEHCSYKSSRIHLRRLPTKAAHVIVGPGENAGVIDVGDGVAVALRIESHNHPSAIEPYQGAATGVGGILRDIFTMGARPIALMDPLLMGPLEDPRSRWIFDGVVRGIAGYGNSVGVPTVGGEIVFGERYAGNPLVNVFCLGVLPRERLVLARASGVGNVAVLLGSRTGRDGIGGVSVLASAGFGGGAAPEATGGGSQAGSPAGSAAESAKRPSVQVGDPFEEKRLIEACLELLDAGAVVGIQDLGGAGLSCATSETAARAGLGMDVDVDAVPCREPGMTPIEVMTSESQERMLAIVPPECLPDVHSICDKWEVLATVIGRVVPAPPAAAGGTGGLLRIRSGMSGPVLAEVPAQSLADGAPLYDRPLAPPADLAARRSAGPTSLAPPDDCGKDLLELLYDPAWIYRQYDHQLFLNTVIGPGEGDAAVLRLAAPGVPWAGKGLALSTDSNAGWCAVDPRLGTALTVAESALNVACGGGRPLAIVNCLNFGNPEHEEVMWQLSEAIDGMAEACSALALPVVGGNVSLYNESGGVDIDPTPVIGTVGLIDRLDRRPAAIGLADGGSLILLGARSSSLAGSRWARQLHGVTGGELPPLDFELHARLLVLVQRLVRGDPGDRSARGAAAVLDGIHDVSDGGLAVCLAELACAAPVGLQVHGIDGHAELFCESPSRVVVCSRQPDLVLRAAADVDVPAEVIGLAGGDRLVVDGLVDLELELVRRARAERIPRALDFATGDRAEA
jgi:phosphoribosylformylglycinamidine synthase subunit PurL